VSHVVGSLDFAAKDEDLRVFFESLLTTERQPAPDGQSWVTHVRIVRDADTQLGKGFAYVEFAVSLWA
jgi:nucleolar protein 12